jgi:hypothetical protein
VAAAWLTNAPAAVMVTYSLALLAVVVALARRSPRVLLWAGLAVLLGMGLAAFYVFPAAYEQKWVNISEVLAPGVRPQDNFLFTLINDPDHNRFNLLVSLVAAAEMVLLAGAVGLLRMSRLNSEDRVYSPEGKALRVALYAWAAAATLLMFSGTFLAWRYLPQLRFLQLPWRWLLCLNVAFAILISMAWRRWLPRLLLCCLMLVVIVLVWQRVQPPWWDTAADIDEMRANIAKGVGHEGTDEYVPAGVDPYEIKQDAPRVTLEGDGEARINIQQWDPEAKSFSADVTAPGKLVLRLFDYPAWKAEVNGHPVAAETREITGQMMIPVTAGKNRVQLTFIRTWDRTAGGVISMLAIVVLLAGFLIRRTKPSDRNWSLARLYSVSSVSSVV